MPITFNRTRTQLAQLVLGKIQQVIPSEAVSVDMDAVYEACDIRLKEMHALGIFWRNVTPRSTDFTVPANTISASAASVGDMLFPIAMHVVDGSLDEPVMLIGVREYAEIPNKTQGGVPEKAYWTGTQSAEFLFWPRPTAATTAKLHYQAFADDTSAGGVLDIDVSMLRAVVDLVKYDLGDQYGVSEEKMKRWQAEATLAERRIRNLSAPRTDYAVVKVDDWKWTAPQRETDYNR